MEEKTKVQADDGREFAELLKLLNDKEKAQVKGIMIGLGIAREARAAQAAARPA